MPYTVYILYSSILDSYYIDQTQNIDDRLFRHNNSGSKSTRKTSDWQLVYHEIFETRATACARETEIKKKKSRKYIELLIQ